MEISIQQSIYDLKGYLLGRVLTVVDASFSDVEQRKAMKDVIKTIFYDKEYWSDNILSSISKFLKEANMNDKSVKHFCDNHVGYYGECIRPSEN